jgi:hypothetical protein
MREKMKAVLARLGFMAKSYLPEGLIETLLEMAAEIDRLRAEIEVLKKEK